MKSCFGEARLFSVAVPAFLYCFCIFMLYPLMGLLFVEIACRTNSTDADDDCSSSEISALASKVILYGSLAGDIPTFFCVGYFSALSDKHGRRIAMFVPAAGASIYFAGIFFIILFHPESYLYIFVAVSFLHGCLGSYSTFLMSSFSYLADISSPADRPRLYSYLGIIIICFVVIYYVSKSNLILCMCRRGCSISCTRIRTSNRWYLGSTVWFYGSVFMCSDPVNNLTSMDLFYA